DGRVPIPSLCDLPPPRPGFFEKGSGRKNDRGNFLADGRRQFNFSLCHPCTIPVLCRTAARMRGLSSSRLIDPQHVEGRSHAPSFHFAPPREPQGGGSG